MAEEEKREGRFGTFGGVWTPSVLTILGVIMFMRSGFVVGDSGIWLALLILLVAKTITTLTTLSLSAIATNTEVGAGGNYFMISRTLGPAIGGTIGITLFFSQAVAIAFYVIGFTEALFGVIGVIAPGFVSSMTAYHGDQILSCIVIFLLFLLTFKGADLALKAQYIILAVLLLSVASFLIGGALNFDPDVFDKNKSPLPSSVGFWAAFAIFFPAATGIDAGANMSGDLKNPAKSIPGGTLMAIAFTAVIYLFLLVFLAGFTDAETLTNEPFAVLQDMSIFGPLIVAGVFAATLSSALSSFLGAPRILQAMGKDKLLKPLVFFAKGHGVDDEPRRATVLSLFVALAIVWAGGLDAIAEIISMFFLIAYGMINWSAFVEGRAGNPSFRPRFRMFGWPAGIVGAIGCVIAMVKINETYAIVSILLAAVIYALLKGRTKGDWEDATRGYTFARLRHHLLDLDEGKTDSKNWRPQVACLSPNYDRDKKLMDVASWIEGKAGILSFLEIPFVSVQDKSMDFHMADANQRQLELRDDLALRNIHAFRQVIPIPDAGHFPTVLSGYSLGPLKTNTFMLTLPPPNQPDKQEWALHAMRAITQQGQNIVLYKGSQEAPATRRIDIWWNGHENGSLMALFAHLLMSQPSWKKSEIWLRRVVKDSSEKETAEASLAALMEEARMSMQLEAIVSEEPVRDVIADHSSDAGLVFMGFSTPDMKAFSEYIERNTEFFGKMPTTLLVHSNGDVNLRS